MILTEFDKSKAAVINPWDIVEPVAGIPEIAISCYAKNTFERMIHMLGAEKIAAASDEIEVYEVVYSYVG